ncbi:MAG: hypothetical protein JSU73_08715 [candidate division WOR-3 bacterium]|nr:MAG: hypothetical protein JSU73_08715 [candidate division WOR-3 bacterium]
MKKLAFVAVFLLLAATSVQGQYQHLTITADSLASALAPLCEYLEEHAGLEDTVVTVAQVLASSSGRDNQEKVRNFIKQAYTDWGVTHVLLAADHDQIPCRLIWVEINTQWRDWIPTELYFAALDGNWDADMDGQYGEPEDSVDFMPDVYLGRVALATPGEMARFVEHFLTYSEDSTAAYLEDVLLAGFDFSATYRGELCCEIYDSLYLPQTMRAYKVYDSHSPHNHEDSVKTLLDQGMHVWVQYDHCDYNVMGCGYTNHRYLLWVSELDDMRNGTNYSIMLAAGCYPSAFDSSFCMSETLLTLAEGGCVATCANSRVGFGTDPDPYRGGSVFYVEKCLEWFWTRGNRSSMEGVTSAHGQAAALAASDVVWRWCHFEFLLSGEPAMPVWVPEGSGVAEERTKAQVQRTSQTIVKGVLVLQKRRMKDDGGARLVDAAGRVVMELRPGQNDVRGIAPGVYFVRGEGPSSRVVIAD